jgi:uncharacterized protein YyaL (SSP411 family)
LVSFVFTAKYDLYSMSKFTNRLANESSPYLLQHAHNPVDWYPWGEEALEKARKEDKPILVSIGYAACHWCHVMEKESFEDEATAAIMNEHFVNIKIDREERPDLDHIYMDAVQAMTGSGGWPLNVFLMPDCKPFYGGTYFPPQRAFNRPSWKETLLSIQQAYSEKRHEIAAQAYNLTEHIAASGNFGQQDPAKSEELFTSKNTAAIFSSIMRSADKEWGGFGRAPKFPQTQVITFLLRYYYITQNSEALDQTLLSLDKMMEGGIYDQVGGGFARYSTDSEWLAPHFEKMLYDNALLVSALSEACSLTKKNTYRQVIEETIAFIQRELMDKNSLFYSAIDADSEGEEGRFYVWSFEEVQKLLQEEAPLFCSYYDITPGGNWEHKNIPRVRESPGSFAAKNNIAETELVNLLQRGKEKLLQQREKRPRPLLDDKILLGWNGLMNTALCKAYAATGREEYKSLAIANMGALLEKFTDPGSGDLYHTWKNGLAKFPAFLDDRAFLIQALIYLQEITADEQWLNKAAVILEQTIAEFSDEAGLFFLFTPDNQKDVIVRKKEVYDGAVPSGNATMAYNLYQLGLQLDNAGWRERGTDMLASLGAVVLKYPTSFGLWACLLLEIQAGTLEIAVTGKGYQPVLKEILSHYIPHRVLAGSGLPGGLPLLRHKEFGDKTNIWLCQNYSCQAAVNTVTELITLIDRGKALN